MTVLGISIGTKGTGICVLRDGELIDANVHYYHTPWSDLKLRAIVNQYRHYVRRYGVTAIIIKVPPPINHTPAVRRIMAQVEGLAKQYYCEFDLTTKTEIRSTLSLRSGEIAGFARQLYPELQAIYEKGARNGHGYHKKLYEAVLSAYLFQQRKRARLL
ncbi:MAG: hypothetical protein ABIN91_02930 [Mucilaginibacter sp.]|uniref:hypothetical protein n=1 Tax=Mucilaginibacter sp. TaxID=1882438 RepID=UPI0032652004